MYNGEKMKNNEKSNELCNTYSCEVPHFKLPPKQSPCHLYRRCEVPSCYSPSPSLRGPSF